MPTLRRSVLAFGAVGVAATTVHVVIGMSLVELAGTSAFWANIVAFLTAFLVSYFGHRHLTFQSSVAHRTAAPKFLITALFGLVLNQCIVYGVVTLLAQPYEFALVLIVTLVPISTFLLAKFWAFAESTPPVEPQG